MSEIEDGLGEDSEPMQDVVNALQDVEQAVKRVEEAVKNKWSTVQWIGVALIAIYVVSLPGQIWHSKWRYALNYGVGSDKVIVEKPPHDCAFLAAPLGEKYCLCSAKIQWMT